VNRICVVTQDLALGGGEYAKQLSFLGFAESLGMTCDIYYSLEGPRPIEQERELSALDAVDELHPVRVPRRAPHFWRAHVFSRRCAPDRGYAQHVLIATPLPPGRVANSGYTASQLRAELGIAGSKMVVVPVRTDFFALGMPIRRPPPYGLSRGRLDRRNDYPTVIKTFHGLAGIAASSKRQGI